MSWKIPPFFLLCALAVVGRAQDHTAAVFPMQSRGVDSNSTRILEEAIANGLVEKGGLRILERSQVSTILDEQGFQQSGACDGSECAVQMGKLLGVDRGVVGSVGLLGKTWVLNARIVDIRTGEVVRTSQRAFTGEIDRVLTELVPQVVADLTAAAPAKAASRTAAPATVTGPSPKRSTAWIWWTAGGVALAGGAAAAAILLMDDGGGSGEAGAQNTTSGQSGDLVFQWKEP